MLWRSVHGMFSFFFRVAGLRYTEAQRLRDLRLTLAAVYLAGYTVECVLKALLLAATPEQEQRAVMGDFRGQSAHDFAWLLERYRSAGGAFQPREVTGALLVLNGWETALRYSPTADYDGDVAAFFLAVETVTTWARSRIP